MRWRLLGVTASTVSLILQFFLPHSRGSSHGQTRIIRKAYPEDFYVHMMDESYQLWAQLEQEVGTQLHRCAAGGSP